MKADASFVKPFHFYVKKDNTISDTEVKIENCTQYVDHEVNKVRVYVADADVNEVAYKYAGEFLNTKSHLCWQECKNCFPSKCQKIFDSEKQNIENYPFIEEGFQLTDCHGNVRKFFVSKCENYEPILKKPKIKAKKYGY